MLSKPSVRLTVEVALGLRPFLWLPYPDSPQEVAYDSQADELFFGGAQGGGKTDCLLGIAGTAHYRSVIFRREFPMHRAAIERSREIFNRENESHARDSFNESLHVWRLLDDRMIEFAAIQFEPDKEKQRGRDRDLHAWDELPQFTEGMYRFVNAWNRSAHVDPVTGEPQRCRIIGTGNPPTTVEGEWVIRYWAPWLDEHHPRPAEPGELRWFVYDPDTKLDVEVEGARAVTIKGEQVLPRSRTFIPARVSDNPVMLERGYQFVLAALPEPLRSQALYGDFSIGIADDAWQAIPTAWVRAAQARWRENEYLARVLAAIGADVAYGGADSTCAVARYGTWFGRPRKWQGTVTDSGRKAAFLLLQLHDGSAPVNVDGIGYGAACVEALRDKIGHLARAINVSLPSGLFDRSRKYPLTNIRAAMYWRLREALDPEHGDNLALPPDPEVLADLCAPRYEVTAAGIKLEEKKKIKERLGRSPDVGDAVALAHWNTGSGIVPLLVDAEGDLHARQPRDGGKTRYTAGGGVDWDAHRP